ncbi:wings apart-like protein regulation of heterochromatin protein [Ceratobasidium sp. AG-Ba]|nr:wings apart-like protein regulation of heterochromatin protein [Ceratobasidium sp. AG-Ba]
MPAPSRSTKRKKPPRVDDDKSSSESATTDDEVVALPSKNPRTNPTLTPTSAPMSVRTPQNTSISRRMKARRDVSNPGNGTGATSSGIRTVTPPPEDTSQNTSVTSSTQSQPQLTRLNTTSTPQQGKNSAEPMSATPTTLGMPAPRRTYSQMRSFLMPLDEMDASGQPLATSAPPRLVPTKSYNDLVLSESQEELQQDTADKNITFNGETDLRSITEMRVKGESRRFGDDIDYVLQGLEGETVVRVRRASAVEFVGRMCEAGFVQRARASDVLGRAWNAIHQSVVETGDRVFDAIAGIFVTLVARELQDVPGALQDTKIPTTFCLILNRARELDGLEAAASDSSWAVYADAARKIGLGKVERKQLSALLTLSQQSGIIPSGQVITTRLLVSHGLSVVIPKPIARATALAVLSTTSTYLRMFDTRLSGYATGLNVIPPSSAGTLHLLQVISNFLRSCQTAIDQQDSEESEEQTAAKEEEEFVRAVILFCRVCQVLMASNSKDLEDGVPGLAEQCALGCLKVLVLLTSDAKHDHSSQSQDSEMPPNRVQPLILENPLAFHAIARFVAQGGYPAVQSTLFEHACLSLALLLNLVKDGTEGGKKLQSLYIYDACTLGRKCANECTCKNRKPELELYTGLYRKLQSMSTLKNDFHSTFVLGYLAVLLGLLTVNDESIKDKVYNALPGEEGSNKFEDLAQSIEQFVHAYERVAQAIKVKRDEDEEEGENEEAVMSSADAGSFIALSVARRLRDIY